MKPRRRQKADEPNLFALKCQECGRQLVGTESGYLVCPNGHGRLIPDGASDDAAGDGPPGLWEE
jgi:hypothetical protein